MDQLPILFARRDLILGNGFVAGVSISGRALLTQESDSEFWCEGINPGGFAAQGSTYAEAFNAFGEEYLKVLFDIAADSANYDAFQEGVQAFFDNPSPTLLTDWDAAVDAVRRGELASQWLRTSRQLDGELQIRVELIREFRAAGNVIQEHSLALAS